MMNKNYIKELLFMPPQEYAHSSDTVMEQCDKLTDVCMQTGGFWEHLTDHLIIAISFFFLGMFAISIYWQHMAKHRRYRVDYELKKGTIMRLFHNGKKTLVVNPSNMVEWFDVILLQYFDRGKDKFIDRHDKRRIRWLTNFLLLCAILLSLSGIILILSAFETDLNIFNYLPF
jgi:hypothetical protein